MTIFEPADATEVWLLTKLALEINGPVYLRTVRCGVPVIFDKTHTLQLGKAVWLRQGTDVSIISSGMMTPRVRHVVETLSERGIDANHIHMPCLKPLDMAAIQRAAKTGLIVTVENHSVIGGLGSAVAEVTAAECPCIVRRIGFQDIFLESGNDEVLFDKYGLSETKILNAIIDVLQLRKLLP
jgi:transketolase